MFNICIDKCKLCITVGDLNVGVRSNMNYFGFINPEKVCPKSRNTFIITITKNLLADSFRVMHNTHTAKIHLTFKSKKCMVQAHLGYHLVYKQIMIFV